MAKYVLTRYALGKHPQLTLTGDEYTAIKRARDSLGEALAIEERLELVEPAGVVVLASSEVQVADDDELVHGGLQQVSHPDRRRERA